MTVQRYEVEAWLGDDHDLTDDQITDLAAQFAAIADRYPDPDDEQEREAARTVAHQLMTSSPEQVVAEWRAARERAQMAKLRAMAALQHAALTIVTSEHRGIYSEGGFAERAGVDRGTVRKWCGKPR